MNYHAFKRYRRKILAPLAAFMAVTVFGSLLTFITSRMITEKWAQSLNVIASQTEKLAKLEVAELNGQLFLSDNNSIPANYKLVTDVLLPNGQFQDDNPSNNSSRLELIKKQKIYSLCVHGHKQHIFNSDTLLLCQLNKLNVVNVALMKLTDLESFNTLTHYTPSIRIQTTKPQSLLQIPSANINIFNNNDNQQHSIKIAYDPKSYESTIVKITAPYLSIYIILGLFLSYFLLNKYKSQLNETLKNKINKNLSLELTRSRNQHNLLELINTNAKVGGFNYDYTKGNLVTTKGLSDIFELQNNHSDGSQYIKKFDKDDQKLLIDRIHNTASGKKNWKLETTILVNGKQKWVRITANHYTDNDRDMLISAVQDITHEKNAELYLAQASIALEQQTYALNHHAIVSITDKNDNIQYVNKKFTDISGYSEDELLGNSHSLINSGHHSKQFWDAFWQTINRGDCFQGDICNKSKSGELFWVTSTIVPCKNIDGEYDSFVAIRTDITARKNAELENERLQNQLIQSQKMETIGKLTGGIAHDFNNILASIMGYAELAGDKVDRLGDAKLSKYLNQINLSGERARDLIKKMLAFGRPSEHEPEQIHLASEMINLYDTISMLLSQDIELTIEIDDDVKNIYFDKVQFQQLIMNMVLNARDAIEGAGTIDIKVNYGKIEKLLCNSCHKEINGDFVIIKISDTGTGMSKETIAKAFDPFFTTKPLGKGTGMGLSVTHGIIHKVGGHLLCKSEINEGTVFTLLLPNQEVKVQHDVLRFKYEEPAQKLNIAVIDDEENILEILHEGLAKQGHNVAVYTNAKEFCNYTPEQKGRNFDIIFTDLSMPECSGFNLVNSSRKNGYNCPIIAMSGYNKDINIDNYKQFSFDDYLSKPFTMDEVVEKIQVNITGG